MEVRAKKSLGQHFLTDQDIAGRIVDSLQGSPVLEVGPGMGVLTKYLIPHLAGQALEPGCVHSRFAAAEYGLSSTPAPATEAFESQDNDLATGLASPDRSHPRLVRGRGPLAERVGGAERSEESGLAEPVGSIKAIEPPELAASACQLKAIEIDKESVAYLKKHFPELGDGLIEGDFLKMDLQGLFPGQFSIIGNFPYNISSQIFFKIIDNRDLVPEVVCMIQKEVAERIAEKPGTKTYGILSVFLQAWYDIEYLFTVGSGAFNPPPKVQSAVIRLTRNSRTELGCDEKLFKAVVKTAFGQRRKTLRNSLKPLLQKAGGSTPLTNQQISEPGSVHSRSAAAECGLSSAAAPANQIPEEQNRILSGAEGSVFDLRPERLSVEDFIDLTLRISEL